MADPLEKRPGNAQVLEGPEATIHERYVAPADAVRWADLRRDERRLGEPMLPRVPGFEILAELGRGGMGVVYKAVQTGLNRLVALKMIRSGCHAGEHERDRFLTEAEAVARLHHPNIVQIHQVGEHEGLPFFSLEYCDGGTLTQKLSGTPQQPREAALLVQTLALAIQTAHDAGIVHRDLKPANVLLQTAPGGQWSTAGGQRAASSVQSSAAGKGASSSSSLAADHLPLTMIPKIADFGLAKRLDDQVHTTSGAVLGTPSYMAPEQTTGHSQEQGTLVDIYALGAILYECLTGRPPFRAPTPVETVLQVMHSEPVAPSQLNPEVPRDLDTICLKCLQKEGSRRYAAAVDLADDLDRFLIGVPIHARPVGAVERSWRWCRRNPVIAGLLLALVGVVGAGLISLSIANMNLADQRNQMKKTIADLGKSYIALDVALKNEQATNDENKRLVIVANKAIDAEKKTSDDLRQSESELKERTLALGKTKDILLGSLAERNIRLAQSRWEQGQVNLAQEALEEVPPQYRTGGWHLLKHRFEGSLFTIARAGRGIAYSPDGQHLAIGGNDGSVRLFDARTGLEIMSLSRHSSSVANLAFSPDGKRLASAGIDGSIKVSSTDPAHQRPPLKLRGHDRLVSAIGFSPDSRRLASASHDGSAKIWDLHTGHLLHTLSEHQGPVMSVCFSPDGKHLASAGTDKTVRLWDAHSGQLLLTPSSLVKAEQKQQATVCFSPDGAHLAWSGFIGTVNLWDLRTNREVLTLRAATVLGSQAITVVCFSPDGRRLACAGTDQLVRLWDVRSGQEIAALRGHAYPVDSVCFSPDGQFLASMDTFGTAKVWDTRGQHDLLSLAAHTHWINSVHFSPDPGWLVSAGHDNSVKLWNTRTGIVEQNCLGHRLAVRSVRFSPSGKVVASAGDDRSIKLWRPRTGEKIRGGPMDAATLVGHAGPVWRLAFDNDGKRLASASSDLTVKVWNVDTGKEIRTIDSRSAMTKDICFSPDGSFLATAHGNSMIRLWPAAGGPEIRTFKASMDRHCVCFSRDGKHLISGGVDKAITIWDVNSGQIHTILKGHAHSVGAVCVSPDGQILASASLDGVIKLWDLHTGQDVVTFQGNTRVVSSVSFSPDGRQLACAGADNAIKVWDVGGPSYLPADESTLFGLKTLQTQGKWIYLINQIPSAGELAVRRLATRPRSDWQVDQARQHEREQNWYAAAFHWSWAFQANPERTTDWEGLDRACRRLGSWRLAQNACLRVLIDHPEAVENPVFPSMRYCLAIAHHRLGQHEKARTCFGRAPVPMNVALVERSLFELRREAIDELGLEKE